MKKSQRGIFFALWALSLAAFAFSTACGESSGVAVNEGKKAAEEQQAAPEAKTGESKATELKPSVRDRTIAVNFARILEARHFSIKKIDEGVSERAFDFYIKEIDPMKIYFTEADIQNFRSLYQKNFAFQLKRGNLTGVFAIYNEFLRRIEERCELAQKILDEPLDFTQDEEIVRDKDLLQFPKNDAEVTDRWRKRIKFEILSLEADNKEKADEKERREKAAEEGKTEDMPKAGDHSEMWANETPVERLHRRYSSFVKRMRQTTSDDVLEAALTALGNVYDPHTTYMSPDISESFNIDMSLNFEGIGATLSWEDGYTQVREIVKGSPAEKQGELTIGDRIIGVGQGDEGPIDDVVDMKLTDVVKKIRGKRGSVVRLQVIPGNRVIKIVRNRIELEESAAKGEIFEVGKKPDGTPWRVGVIDLPSFYLDTEDYRKGNKDARGTTHDVKAILQKFIAEKADACVLDLRYNGGGLLQEATALTGLFIEGGTVVQAKPDPMRRGDRKSVVLHNDPDPGIAWGGPLVVLTNKFSASASEIFAGAIRDYHRGIVIGDETTHGKGSVQTVTPIADLLFGSMLGEAPDLGVIKITVQGFWLPAGDSSQLKGVPSDVVLPSITGHMEGISESDLDNPLSLEKIPPAKFLPQFDYVTPDMVAALAKSSQSRVEASADFAKVNKNIELYKEIRAKKTTTLNRERYFAELEKLDSDKEEEKKFEKIAKRNSEIERDFYLNEILDITADYLDLLQKNGVKFQKEKESGFALNLGI